MKIGVLGGGQLGRMLALAGLPLGLTFRFLDRAPDSVAREVGEFIADGPGEDVVSAFLDGVDVVTYEFENVNVDLARRIESVRPLFPSSAALAASQDRLVEKQFFRKLGIPTAEFAAIDSRDELHAALESIGYPGLLKTRRLGYDGKGQFLIRSREDVDAAWAALSGSPLILEGFVHFSRELSQIAARGRDGEVVFYPLCENEHRQGILYRTTAPAADTTAIETLAHDKIRRALEALNYVGVLTIEFFEVAGRLYANEMAPRVHNSGHWTIDACETCQFENHLRAILGWPLGDPRAIRGAVMRNIVGQAPSPKSILAHPGARLHLYGKSPRPGRKLGHITLLGEDITPPRERAAQLEAPFEA